MRIIISSLILLASFTQTFSQKIVTTHYNSYWLLTTKEYSEFYRTATIDTNNYKIYGIVKDYYKNGHLEMIGTYLANIKQGEFLFYFPSGNLKTKGYYKDNLRWGIWTNYYEDGKVKEKIVYNDIFLSVLEYYDKNGNPKVLKGSGDWQTQYFDEFVMRNFAITGSFRDSLREGEWKYYPDFLANEENQYATFPVTEIYENGKFISGEYYNHDGEIQNLNFSYFDVLPDTKKFINTENWEKSIYASKDEYPFLKFLPMVDSSVFPVTSLAAFPGGADSLRSKIAKKIKLKKSYINSKQHRMCLFKISISEKGILEIEEDPNISTLKIYLDEAVFYKKVSAALTGLPLWNPAFRNQKNVKSHFMLYVILESGTISIKLISINQIIIDPEFNLYVDTQKSQGQSSNRRFQIGHYQY